MPTRVAATPMSSAAPAGRGEERQVPHVGQHGLQQQDEPGQRHARFAQAPADERPAHELGGEAVARHEQHGHAEFQGRAFAPEEQHGQEQGGGHERVHGHHGQLRAFAADRHAAAQGQDEPGVEEPGQQAKEDAQLVVLPCAGPGRGHNGEEPAHGEHEPGEEAQARFFLQEHDAPQGQEEHLEVAEERGQAGADVQDGQVPGH